jgi:hypothetical protein
MHRFKPFTIALSIFTCTLPLLPMEEQTLCSKLHLATRYGHLDKIEQLLNDGYDVNSQDCFNNNTPLFIAAWFGQDSSIDLLIKRGANLHILNKLGSGPVHGACWKNEALCLEKLINHGANVTQTNNTGLGNTPLYLGSKAGSTKCVRILLAQPTINRAEINKICSGDNSSAVGAAATRQNAQCYWDLVGKGADYYPLPKMPSNADTIENNAPFKHFVEIVEEPLRDRETFRKNKLQFIKHDYDYCQLCKQDFQKNDVIITCKPCLDPFHSDCFADYSLDQFMQKNPKITKELRQELQTDKEMKHALKTSPLGNVGLADTCPQCAHTFDSQKQLTYSVFMT